ncbi:Uncharacterised protein [Chlamydia trachomatis]|nr:Uncharacterised protein [Chlamydia trachomatis]
MTPKKPRGFPRVSKVLAGDQTSLIQIGNTAILLLTGSRLKSFSIWQTTTGWVVTLTRLMLEMASLWTSTGMLTRKLSLLFPLVSNNRVVPTNKPSQYLTIWTFGWMGLSPERPSLTTIFTEPKRISIMSTIFTRTQRCRVLPLTTYANAPSTLTSMTLKI